MSFLLWLFILSSSVRGESGVSYYYRSNSHRNPVFTMQNVTGEDIPSKIDFSVPVIVLTHGWLENISADWYQFVSDSYFKLMECTVIFVDWSESRGLYILAALDVKGVGDTIGDFLISQQKNGLNLEHLHMIGFSLGAHVSSNAARRITSTTGIKIKRITALDPAGPMFTFIPDLLKLDVGLEATDAVVVDALHTSLVLGATRQIGTADFYANCLFLPIQPGCLLIEVCSHLRAPAYFNESILSCGFIATPTYKAGPAVIYGEHMETNTNGTYFFQTNSELPYARNHYTCD